MADCTLYALPFPFSTRQCPTTLDQFHGCEGVTEAKYQLYADYFISHIQAFLDSSNIPRPVMSKGVVTGVVVGGGEQQEPTAPRTSSRSVGRGKTGDKGSNREDDRRGREAAATFPAQSAYFAVNKRRRERKGLMKKRKVMRGKAGRRSHKTCC